MEREKGHVRKQENRGAGDTCHEQSKSKVTQRESRAEQSKTERDSVPLASASASARTFIPKSDLVSPTVSLSSLFLQKIPSPSFLPSFLRSSVSLQSQREKGRD